MRYSIHRSDERGYSNHGWLDSRFSFSFADYFNRNRMGFGVMRVLNDDTIAPASGFPKHPHNNMEIITVVTEGTLEHKDSMGNGSIILPGEVQRMSAGSGIMHSEWNPSEDETLKLFQIWIQTRDKDVAPEYEQARFDFEKERGRFVTIVSGEKDAEGLTFHQDAWGLRGLFDSGAEVEYTLKNRGNGVFLFVISGEVQFGDEVLKARDDASLTDLEKLSIKALSSADLLLFELPMA